MLTDRLIDQPRHQSAAVVRSPLGELLLSDSALVAESAADFPLLAGCTRPTSQGVVC